MPKRKSRWRTRTSGTASQRGQHFIIDDESQQHRKARLPKGGSIMVRSREIRDLKEKYQDDPRKLELIEEMEEAEKERQLPKKSTTEKIKSAIKSVRPSEKKTVTKMVGGLPVKQEVEKEQTALEALPTELREDIRPIIEEARRDGHAISNYLLNSRFEHFFERRAMLRKLRKEKEAEERNKQ
jgi:hypothetical protein